MTTYEVKITWLDSERFAACNGNDETVTIDGESPQEAIREALECAADHNIEDWQTGRYRILGECGNNVEELAPAMGEASPEE